MLPYHESDFFFLDFSSLLENVRIILVLWSLDRQL